ncbi:MAG: glycosyltransferase [Acidobacteriota bacterium]|nr:glycosyltransferase [Acidobacteriota bacterium]
MPEVVLNRIQPAIAIYCNINLFETVARFSKDIVSIVDICGPIQLDDLLLLSSDPESAMRDPLLLEDKCRAMVEQIRKADYIMTVSERQKYFWSAYCSMAGFSFEDLNVVVCPESFDIHPVPRNTAPSLTVVYAGGFYPWQKPERFLKEAAAALEKIEGAIFHIFGGPHAGLPNEIPVNNMLAELQLFRCVKYHGHRPIEELTQTLSTAWCALELMERNIERELAPTGHTVAFLSTGTPVINNDYSTLSGLINAYQAGWTLSTSGDSAGLASVFRELVERGTAFVDELSANARRLAAAEFVPERAMAPLCDLAAGKILKRRRASEAENFAGPRSGENRKIRVLAISSDYGAIQDLRVANPLRALQRQGYIDGFKIIDPRLHDLIHDTNRYDVILIQRTVPESIYELLKSLSLPFILDVDDNLLGRAAYKPDIRPQAALISGLGYCSALTVPNPRLVRLLETYAGLSLRSKTYITPNALPFSRLRDARQPSRILWIQSDIAALVDSREAIERAVDEFSVANELPIVLVGRNVLQTPRSKNQVVLGEIDFTSNLQMLEFGSTSIGVAPLETEADPQTLDFVSGKSDLKMLLFAGYGHPGVYSAAPPYTDSPLSAHLSISGNSYAEWYESLEFQFQEAWKTIPSAAAHIQQNRHSDTVARESWAPALRSCLLPSPVTGRELHDLLHGSSRMDATGEAGIGYLLANRDLLDLAIRSPGFTPRRHFVRFGQTEGRVVVHGRDAHQRLFDQLELESSNSVTRAGEKMSEMRDRVIQSRENVDEMRTNMNELEQNAASLQKEVNRLNDILSGVVHSKSWRLTAPLRNWVQKIK